MRACLFLSLTLLLITTCAAAQVVEIPVAETWGARPEWSPNDRAEEFSATRGDGYTSFKASGGKGVMLWVRDFAPHLEIKGLRHVTFRYRLTNTDPNLASYTVYFDDRGEGRMLARNLIFGAASLQHDGEWHTARTTLKDFDTLGTVALRLRALEGQEGRLDVAWLKISATPLQSTLSETIQVAPGHQGEGRPLAVNATVPLAELQKTLDLSDWFPGQQVTVSGVNLTVPVGGAAAIPTPVEPREPVTVPLTAPGQTLYLLLGAQFPPQLLGYSGWQPGDMTDRPEQFRVAVRYAGGAAEEHVPYCVAQGRHGLWRGMNLYAVPLLAGQELQQLVLHDGMRSSSFYLCAATVTDRALAALAEPQLRRTPATGRGLALPANTLETLCRTGTVGGLSIFSVSEGRNRWAVDSFKVSGSTRRAEGTEVLFTHEDAKLEARLQIVPQGDGLNLSLSVRSLAPEPRTLDVIFPQVKLTAANPDDLWYFIPYQCAIWSNRDGSHEYPYSGDLPLQFQDCYDRRTGGGVYIATRDLDLRQRYFQLIKSGGAVIQRIEYRFNPQLKPNEWVMYPRTVIASHTGDWRAAWNDYDTWRQTWYKPAKPRLAWYRDVWNFRTWWTHTMATTPERRAEVNLLDTERGEYQVDRFVQRDREQFGDVDMVHFFDWRISKQYGLWGDYSHYEDLGGLPKFKSMIADLQSRGLRVGLYLDAYLVSRKSLIGQKHGEEWAAHDQQGRVKTGYSQPDDPMLNMCVNHPGWQDYLAETCARVARETGCDGIYIDEGMTDYTSYWCWRTDHPHPVPGVNQPGLLELSRKIKAALPENVALYTEWVPPDAIMPHLDGAYQAGLRHADAQFSPGYVQTARFAFPDFRVLTISNGGSMREGIWEGLKYNIFSGVPLYSLAWGHDEELLPLFRQYSEILHEFGPIFNTMEPRPFLDTEQGEIFANEFPGAKQTVWTLFNGRYRTFTGPVLKVKHEPGATYKDAFSGKTLQPKIVGGEALLETTLGPRGIGVLVQTRR